MYEARRKANGRHKFEIFQILLVFGLKAKVSLIPEELTLTSYSLDLIVSWSDKMSMHTSYQSIHVAR